MGTRENQVAYLWKITKAKEREGKMNLEVSKYYANCAFKFKEVFRMSGVDILN